jgi:thiosulfate/3-mercaptopyruvate sulfurtransferase
MAVLVSAPWVEERVDSSTILLLDPRRPMKYLQGHLKHAVNLPVLRLFDAEAKLLPDDHLQQRIGAAGLDDRTTPVIYDSYDGQNGAMLTWILEYFGRSDVHVLKVFFEHWVAEGRHIFYKPVRPVAKCFTASVNPKLRATIDDLRTEAGWKLIDFRSREEYTGQQDRDGKPGHIPKAVHVAWRDLVGGQQEVLAPVEKVEQLVQAAGIQRGDTVVGYCRSGLRAGVGYLALQQAGYDIRLYDRSYAEWARSDLPVEV